MKRSRITTLILSFIMVSSLVGCGTKSTSTSSSSTKDPVTVTMFIQKNAIDAWGQKMKDQFEAQNKDIKIEFNILAEGVDSFQKMDMSVMSGDKTDVVLLQNPNHYSKYVSGKLLKPINDIAKEANYDIKKVYGDYAKQYENGTYYWLPDAVTMNIVYYNKGLFDAAKIPYPTGKWTWDDYTTIAKKLTDTSKGKYGSLMELDWEYYNYILANQKKTSAYKADGTSNFDDPIWKTSLKWLNDLSAVEKVQPSLSEFMAKKLQFDSFLTGNYGMEMIGSWFIPSASDYTKYPRSWKLGVSAPPANADGKNILSAGGGFGISKSSAHPKEAFKFITYMCENEYIVTGGLSARADLKKEDILKAFKTTSEKLKGEVTPEELYNACYPEGYGVANEKIIGTASAQINDLYAKETQKYFFGKQSLDDTIKNLKTQANDFIAKEKASTK
ncbi:extracellular solute-binding protein [Clostridium estertheticum]|uniref:ABC transporter substrate-binding protein n=1 Tax=Clostridium estertheticum TaxID=238834 RepID=UPI001C0AB313|nr:extracellular solute-binding protein [Clostridium estertheticum]MBU3199934.1 extracellular solute-binding protein [Clostridium estertheticum]WAG66968.1 extracellular solute-binding protein [Clostridium estertheticum]